MKIVLLLTAAMVGAAIIHALELPVWLVGPPFGFYIGWQFADEFKKIGNLGW